MAKAIAAGACDHAMPDIMKIGGVTGWLRAAALAEAASLPVSSHIFIEASAHVLPVTPTALYLEYLDSAGAILSEPLPVVDGNGDRARPGPRDGMGRREGCPLCGLTCPAMRPE